MSDSKKIKDGAVSSLANSDLVMCSVNGIYHPISFANLMAAVRDKIQIGGRNLLLITGYTSALGCTWSNGKVVMSMNADSYFYVKVSPSADLKVGETYTISFDCNGLPSGSTWVMAGVAGASPFNISMINGRNKATFVMNAGQLNSNPGYFMFDDGIRSFPNGFSNVTLSNFKLERGNIATDWSPAPEDVASGAWGGVIGYLPITYKLTEKGGAHERSEKVDRQAEFTADSHLTFASLDAMCRFIGQSVEDRECDPVADQSDMFGCRRGSTGLFKDYHRHQKSACRYEWQWRIPSDDGLRRRGKDTVVFSVQCRRRVIHPKIRVRFASLHMGRLEATRICDLADRKEVAA